MVSLICATSANNVIGVENRLPWKLPADLKRFKDLTLGHPIIMGRKTYESIGRPLPGRTNIVVTRQKGYAAPGATVAHSLEEAIEKAKSSGEKQEIFVIGGESVYQQALRHADKIYLTRIHRDFQGDARLFDLNQEIWKETSRQDVLPGEESPFPYTFCTYEKR